METTHLSAGTKNRSNRIGRRLILLIVAVSSLLTFFLTAFQLLVDYRQERADMEKLLNEVKVLLIPVAASVWTFDQRQIVFALDSLIGLPNIERVVVETTNGEFRWSVGQQKSSEVVTRSYPLQYHARGASQQIGRVEIVASLDAVRDRVISRAAAILLSNGLKTILVVAFMLFIFRRLVTRRIELLAGSVDKFELILDKTPETQAPVAIPAKADEIDTLQWAFYRMAERLGADVQELQRAHEDTRLAHAELELRLAVQRETEKALLVSEEKYRQIVEVASEGIWSIDAAHRTTVVNPALCRMLGYRPDEMLGVPLEAFIFEADFPDHQLQMQARHAGHGTQYERRFRCRNGGECWCEVSTTALKGDEPGVFVGSLAVVNDITKRKQADAELEKYHLHLEAMVAERTADLSIAKDSADAANLAKSRFLAAASHDLRQPMQAINLFHSALDRTKLNEEQKRISDFLSQSIRSLNDLLNALLDISKLDAGVVRSCPEVISVETLFNRIDAEFSSIALAKSLRFKLCFPLREMAVFTDSRLLMSLLNNLIGNAIKYTEQGGVLISIRRRGKQALIQVWDNGIGIAPEYMNSIFEEYFQIENIERDRAKGLGLGLAIVKRVAKLLDTEVAVRSRRGQGSVFEFRLPLADQPWWDAPRQMKQIRANVGPVRQGDSAPGISSGLVGRHVVVVEDDVMVAKAIQLFLELLGMSVTRYGNAEDALANAETAPADFYISDLRLPGLNGVQFLDAIQQRSTKPINAVVLTGDTSPDRIEMTQSSRWTVLFKPIDLAKLLSAMEALTTAC